jgi:hypothetical protein
MAWLGVREAVGLVLFVVAVALSLPYVDPSPDEPRAPREVALGQPVHPLPEQARAAPVAAPAAEGALPEPLPRPASWIVTFHPGPPDGSAESRIVLPALELVVPGAPLAGMADDGWSVAAEAAITFQRPGAYGFTLEHEGEVRVFVDGQLVVARADGPGPQELAVRFEHAPGTAVLRVEALDVGGPVKLALRIP